MDYQPLRPTAPAALGGTSTGPKSESLYWRKFKSPIFVKHFAPVTCVSFVPSAPAVGPDLDAAGEPAEGSNSVHAGALVPAAARQRFAVTAATRVQVYSMKTQRVVKTVSRFKDVARSGNIRYDGKLMVAGDDGGLIQVFDVNSRAILRTMRGHTLPVHVTRFSSKPTEVLSCSDDRSVRLWDLSSETCVRHFEGHTDYVRSGSVSPDNPSLLLSGGYDSTVRLWDSRMGEMGGQAMEMSHGAPVEDSLVFPTGGGGLALSAGGPVLRVWDLMMGGRSLRALSNHQKTITSLALSLHTSADLGLGAGHDAGVRVLTAGLDHLVKVYDPARGWTVVHTMRYPSPVLCLALSPDESQLAAGMADGTLCVRKRDVKAAEAARRAETQAAMGQGTYEYFMAGAGAGATEEDFRLGAQRLAPGDAASRKAAASAALRANDDIRVEATRRRKLAPYDKLLKSFRYRDALDAALQPGVSAAATFALLLELVHRSPSLHVGGGPNGQSRSVRIDADDGLRRAIAGRDDVALEPILRFLLRHATNPAYSDLVCDTLNVVVDTYAPVLGQSPLVDDLFGRIWAKLSDEVRLQRDLVSVRGALEMVLHRAALT